MHHRRCIRYLAIVLGFSAIALCVPRVALAATLLVNPTTGTVNPNDSCPVPANSAVYKTIQKAVTCAASGDTIRVAPGIYAENVAIGKPLTNGISGAVDALPWLVLNLTVTPAGAGVNGGTVTLGASLRKNSLDVDTTGLGYAPDGIPAQFSGTMGTVSPVSALTVNGVATSVFAAGPMTGTANVVTTLDYQSAANTVTIRLRQLYLSLIVKDG